MIISRPILATRMALGLEIYHPLAQLMKEKIELIRNSLYKYYTQLVFKYNGDLQFVKKTMFLLILMDLGYID